MMPTRRWSGAAADPARRGESPVKVILALALMAVMVAMLIGRWRELDPPAEVLVERRQALRIRPPAHDLQIAVHPMVEFDFLPRARVLEMRAGVVASHAGLIDGPYTACEEIFGGIVDGRPWWGIQGIFFHGPGERSIDGPSEESRFVMNPFALVGLVEPNAYINRHAGSSAEPFEPRLLEVLWRPDRSVSIRYDLGRFFEGQREHRCGDPSERKIDLVAYNARDFGLHWLLVDESASRNVEWLSPTRRPALIRQFIHCGGSCGYPGGGNNMSPFQADLEIRVPRLPASAAIRLWHAEPERPDAPADFVVNLAMQ